MVTKTEGRHAAEFIMSEANGSRSRENGVVKTGEVLKAGEVVQLDSGKLVSFDATTDSNGDADPAAVGVVIEPVDATSADVRAAYIARDAEVNLHLLTYPTGTGDEAVTIASLAALGVIARS
jgi:hypothetical protein